MPTFTLLSPVFTDHIFSLFFIVPKKKGNKTTTLSLCNVFSYSPPNRINVFFSFLIFCGEEGPVFLFLLFPVFRFPVSSGSGSFSSFFFSFSLSFNFFGFSFLLKSFFFSFFRRLLFFLPKGFPSAVT